MNNRYPSEMVEAAKAEIERRKQAARDEINRRSGDNGFLSQASKVPGYAIGEAISLPGQIYNLAKRLPTSAKKIVTHPIDSARDIAGGIARGAQNLGSAGLEAGEYLTRKGAEAIGRSVGNPVTVPKWDAREFAGLGEKNPIDLGKMIESKNPDPILSGLGQYGLGGAASAGKGILNLIGGNALNAALQANPGERLKSGVEGAVGIGLPIGIGKGVNALRPSRLFSGNLTPEQLQSNLEAAQGTNTGLGDVIGSPALKRLYENVLPRLPGSSADRTMQGTANQLIEKGKSHLSNLGEGLPEGDLGFHLQDALKKASIEANKQKNLNFKKVNDIADEIKLSVGRENFQKKAKKILNEINKSEELKREISPDILSDIKSYAKKNNSQEEKSNIILPVGFKDSRIIPKENGQSLKNSNIFKGKLNDRANEFFTSGKKYEYGLIQDLKNALSKDIDLSISSSKSPELKSAYDTAMKKYASDYKPFEDRDITKFTRKGGDSDLILSHFLKRGANDRSKLLSKVQDKLPDKLQHLPAYMYLSRAIENGQLNPMKLRKLYNDLGEKQKETLIPDKSMRESLNKYTKSIGMNTEAFNTMFNPKTGQRVSDLIPAMGAMGGWKAGSAIGGVPGGLIGGAAGLVLPGMAGKAGVKLLTNPSIREGLVKAMIKAKNRKNI